MVAVSEPTLFDILEAEYRRDIGMALAEEAADIDWKDAWRQTIALLAAIGDPFCSDDVRAIAGDPWDHPNAAGAIMRRAATEGLIELIGYRKSERPALHSHPIGLWRGIPR
jgi:hypothetical protein